MLENMADHQLFFTDQQGTEMTENHYQRSPSIAQMADKPLFGVTKRRDQILHWSFAIFTSVLVTVTVISAFIFPSWPPSGLNIFFAVCITLMCPAHIALILWYNEGGVDPKFRLLIYYNALVIVLLCSCANCYYHLS